MSMSALLLGDDEGVVALDPAARGASEPPSGTAVQPVVSLRLQTRLGEVELFTVIATLGAPLDVTAANLAIETFLPMDPTSASRLERLLEVGP